MVSPTIERARYLQMGKQSAFGTAVPATFRYPQNLTFQEDTTMYEPGYPQGVRSDVSGQLVPMENKTTLQVASEMTFEELIAYLSMCLKGGVTASVVDVAAQQWTFTPPVAGDPTPNFFTFEFAPSNFTTNFGRQVPDCLCDKLTLKGSFGKTCDLTASLFGRKSVPAFSVTPALTNMTGREVAVAGLSKVFIDGTGAGIGTTQLVTTILDWEITMQGGLKADYTLDGRASLDYTQYLYEDISGEVKLTCEYTSAIDAEMTAWRNRTPRFIQILVEGSVIPGTTPSTTKKSLTFQMCGEYVAAPTIATTNGIDTVSLTLKSKYDPTWAQVMNAVVLNAITTLT